MSKADAEPRFGRMGEFEDLRFGMESCMTGRARHRQSLHQGLWWPGMRGQRPFGLPMVVWIAPRSSWMSRDCAKLRSMRRGLRAGSWASVPSLRPAMFGVFGFFISAGRFEECIPPIAVTGFGWDEWRFIFS